MGKCNDIYEIVTVYYPKSCFTSTTTTSSTSTTSTTTSTSSTTTTSTTIAQNTMYRYRALTCDCSSCDPISYTYFYNSETLTIGKWYNFSFFTSIWKIQIEELIEQTQGNAGMHINDADKKDTCGELPPCPQ